MARLFFSTLLLILSCPCQAHLNSVSFSSIVVSATEVRVELRFTLICTLELFPADKNGNNLLSAEELSAVKPAMYYYLTNKIKILSGGRQLRMVLRDLTFEVEEDDSYTIFQLAFPRSEESKNLIIFCNVSEEADPYHRNLAEIKLGDKDYLFVFTNVNYFDSAHPPLSPAIPLGVPAAATPDAKVRQ
ncbi:MAG: hypothetical protein AB1656_26505 [Candidatus Omnitrophota bacterium]